MTTRAEKLGPPGFWLWLLSRSRTEEGTRAEMEGVLWWPASLVLKNINGRAGCFQLYHWG